MSTNAKKHTYKATFKAYNGEEICVTRTSTHDYKSAWMVQVRVYGWRMRDGKREEYDYVDTDCGFTSLQPGAVYHAAKEFDIVGRLNWAGQPYEQHNRILLKASVPVEIIK